MDHPLSSPGPSLVALHQLALADGDFSAEEARLLAEQLGTDLAQKPWQASPDVSDADLLSVLARGTPEAENFLRTAVIVALAEGHLSREEFALIQHWSALLEVGGAVLTGLHPEGEALDGVRRWLDGLNPHDPAVAGFLVHLIPAQCPFERDIILFGHKVVHVPPMCTINPLYNQLVALRLGCLTSLADAPQAANH
ncbi:Mo-dependent nitrogenase C-terminal domain-containing protein [Cyanobium sp. Morenito 9A2]|uniref:Mo-dependent nitrogenase C-terminal domain-containing protein n=1 Tax=Cyanobium sp. Morenito 9A2 TaxID=2823718 RepID=UPI0020CD624C|nr:Mo-dependent nitrogenase C-terminal domain-containing protein [Cyanobium sp. Morenito 9A2]MCP9850572.1 Mo-dependent nitrogenase [Cyanobium sp. Morenito 9A2]